METKLHFLICALKVMLMCVVRCFTSSFYLLVKRDCCFCRMQLQKMKAVRFQRSLAFPVIHLIKITVCDAVNVRCLSMSTDCKYKFRFIIYN